ncbi:MAG: DUF1127 domain-containing protein [Pseudomonadota bacterium]
MSGTNANHAGFGRLMRGAQDAPGATVIADAAHDREATPSAPLSEGLRSGVAVFFARIVARWQDRRARAELAESDDRLLADIGLTRRDVPRAAPSTALRDLYR